MAHLAQRDALDAYDEIHLDTPRSPPTRALAGTSRSPPSPLDASPTSPSGASTPPAAGPAPTSSTTTTAPGSTPAVPVDWRAAAAALRARSPVKPASPVKPSSPAAATGAGGAAGAANGSSASPASASPSKHARNESNVSAASAQTTSDASFEEVGFDDGSPPWTEAPADTFSLHSAGSPARSERTVLGALVNAAGAGAGAGGSSMSTPSPARASVRTIGSVYSAAGSVGSSPAKVFGGLGLGLSGVREGEIPLVLGVAVVDFNHLVGPTVEFAYPQSLAAAIHADDDMSRLLPFLALPDGSHLSDEDYSFFHCSYNGAAPKSETDVPPNRTLFGISCNRQIAAADLLNRGADVTRSMVQKAVIVLASQPVFGPVRDRLGVVTRAFFAQRDFQNTQILEDFYESLNASLEGKAGENAIYMATSLRELVHKFRHRTLVLLKMMLLQKRIMLFGYPVEMLCTYQYSLVSLVPGLLMALRDAGAPHLDARKQRIRPTSLRTSDRASLLRYMGLPLHLFGADAMFQPYLPLQQIDMLQAHAWLVGTTNQIVTQQRDCKYDLLVNIEQMSFEFNDPKIDKLVQLTSADRKWMDDIVRVVEESWNAPEGERPGFVGSDDDLRARFEEYICGFLASLKYADFLASNRPIASGPTDGANPLVAFSEPFAAAFRRTTAYEIWDSTTDPVIFDLSEPRHPCDGQVNTVSDIGIRIAEGLHDLRIDEQLAPTREAVSSAFAAGSASIFRAFDGMRTEVNSRIEAERQRRAAASVANPTAASPLLQSSARPSTPPPATAAATQPAAAPAAASTTPAQPTDVRAALGSFGSSVGSFFGSRIASLQKQQPEPKPSGLRPMSLQAKPTGLPPRTGSPGTSPKKGGGSVSGQ